MLIAGKRFGKLLKQLLYTILLLLAPSGFFISAFASGATITIFEHRTTNTKGYDRYHTEFFMDFACFGITLRRWIIEGLCDTCGCTCRALMAFNWSEQIAITCKNLMYERIFLCYRQSPRKAWKLVLSFLLMVNAFF